MSGQSSVYLDLRDLRAQLPAVTADTQKQIQKAITRANRKLIAWLKRQTVRELAQATGVPQKAITPRIRITQNQSAGTITLWVGLNPIEAQRVGQPRQTRSGVRVGRRLFSRAFVARVFDSTPKVWRRKYAGQPRFVDSMTSAPRHLLHRFPLVKMVVDIADASAPYLTQLRARALTRYGELLNQELNYALRVES